MCGYLWLVDVHGGCHLPLSDLALQRVQHQTRLTHTGEETSTHDVSYERSMEDAQE